MMSTISSLKSFAMHTAALAALTLPIACGAGADVADAEEGGVLTGQPAAIGSPPGADAEPFSLTPEGASPEDGYWVSTVGFDAAGKPVLLDAYTISEVEMLGQSAKIQAAVLANEEQPKLDQVGGSLGTINKPAAGTLVTCGTSAASNSLIFTDGVNFAGNRMCVNGGGNLAWFPVHNYYWFFGTPNQKRVSGNIGSYAYTKRFFIEAWVDNRIQLSPTTWTGPTERCFSVAPTNCGNPNGCTSGGGQNANTRGQCGQYITWLFI